MGYDAKTERLISIKKLSGKAQTSNDKGLSNEGLPSGITMASTTVFGASISTNPPTAALYDISGSVEYVRFASTFIAGTDTSDGRHGFQLTLPSDYESNSSNSKAGTYPYINSQAINITSGALQLIPPSFATAYEATPYYGGSGTKGSGTVIPVLDARDWYFDYFNGIFFQQDPSGTGDQADNPDYIEGYLYIGDMLSTVVSNATGSGGTVTSGSFNVPSAGEFVTTASISVAGGEGMTYTADSIGTDAYFFVSGTSGAKDGASAGVGVFGGDLVISGATHCTSFTPLTDNTYDLGSSDKRFANIYTGDLHLQNERGNWTVIEEENYLSLRNNKTGKKFKIMMELLPDDD